MRKQPHFLRRFAVTAAVALALCAGVSAQAASLVPLGRAVGIQMTTAGMLVADLAEVLPGYLDPPDVVWPNSSPEHGWLFVKVRWIFGSTTWVR